MATEYAQAIRRFKVAAPADRCYERPMSNLPPTGPNAEQITYWNEAAAPKWIRYQRELDTQLRSLGERTIDRAAVGAGERVLDVGCGCGATTMELARRVGPDGRVVGLAISTPMLEQAAARVREAGLRNVELRNADAETCELPAEDFDVVISRFGVMFFADPARAFTNVRRALRRNGRLAFVCWQSLERNPWLAVPMAAAAREIAFPPAPAPHAPGPFAFADPDRVQRILEGAGFAGVTIEPREEMLTIGGESGAGDAADFLVQMGPTGAALRQADPAALPRVSAAVQAAIRPCETGGRVRMPSAAWLVSAVRKAEETR
jgi:SAM-dependent methyltransferase